MSVELVTAIMFGGLIVGLVLGAPVAFTMGGIATIVTFILWGPQGLLLIVSNIFGVMWNMTYLALPLFIFMGVILQRSGIADDLFEAMHRWSGPVRGGIAMGTVIVCAVFAAMTGMAGAATVTMGLIAIPAMLKRRYDKGLALGTVAGAGTLGILIPPSILMIILAPIGKISVGALFMGGVLPGILLSFLFIAYIGIRGFLQPNLCPAHGEKFTLRQKIASTRALILPALIIVSVMGSIFFGIATPTEASAVGGFACIVAVAINRRLTWRLVRETTVGTINVVGSVLWIFFCAVCFAAVYAAAGGYEFISGIIVGLEIGRWGTLLVIMGIAFALGCFLEPIAIMFIILPVAFPVIKALGFDPIWFGVLFIINIQVAYMTPPYGYQLFYLKSVVPPGITMVDIYRSIVPFLVIMLVGIAVCMLFPQIVTWLPEMM